MNFQICHFATIRLSSENVQKSKEFYSGLFSIDPIEEMENFVSFKLTNTLLDISLADEKSPMSKGGSVGYWLVDDLDKVIKKATALGGLVYRGPLRVEEIKKTIVQILDPVGNVVGFEEDFK